VNFYHNIRLFIVIFTIFFITSCAINTRTIDENLQNNIFDIENLPFRGRLALQIAPDAGQAEAPPRHFSGAFELNGNPNIGELVLLTPLGGIAAQLSWQPQSAKLVSEGQTREYADLGSLLRQLTGADLPIDGLFAWMRGQPLQITGWAVDLSRHGDGRIVAQRAVPAPALDLRIVIER
jgi:outer membrane lipoprotein LolB